MKNRPILRHLFFILLGVLVLVFKSLYTGPFADLINNHGSNFSVSFAVYFIAMIGFKELSHPKLSALIGAFLAVQLFELTNGFGVMSNVYDPWDLLANTLGIALAFGLDWVLAKNNGG